MLLVLLTAVFLRLFALSTTPPGLTHDEADHGLTAWAIVNGAREIYFTIGYGREPLYDYLTAVLMTLLGPTFLAGRLTAVFASLLLIPTLAAWVKKAFGWETAVFTAAGLAVSFWPLMTARQSLRSIMLPLLFVLALYLFWQGVRISDGRKWASFAGAGLVLGLSFYTYIPARVLWLLFPLALLYLAWQNRPLLRRVWPGVAVMLLLAGLVGAPLFLHLAANPEAEARIGQLAGPLTAAAQGDFAPLLQNALAGLGILFVQGDDFWRYNIPGRPLLSPLWAILFFVGIGRAAWISGQGKETGGLRPLAAFFAIAWLFAGLAPALVTGPHLSTTQAIGAQPVVYLFPAIGLLWLAQSLLQRRPEWVRLAWTLPVLLFGGTAVSTANAYFHTWADEPAVRVEYESTLMATLQSIEARGLGDVAISTHAPDRLYSPAVAAMVLSPERANELRWFNGQGSLLAPNARQSAIVVSGFAAIHPALERYFAQAVAQETLPLRETDLDRPLTLYAVDGVALAEEWRAQFIPLPDGPANFGDMALFLGYDLQTPVVRPGEVVTLATLWRVERPLLDAVLFTHLTDESGTPIAQADRLDAPGGAWQTGDHFIQLHQFVVGEETAVGQYPLRVGLYTCSEICPEQWPPTRLPIRGSGADSLLIGLVEIRD
jgi:4-amino-4-deoxy-L-arabinose transferase-like glycosyltransferase